ncbi:hypothetical protein Vretimale_12549 [Volvox reticuliferus]|uniref:Uncharacterized protein n=1 Tax=Volvox reticuliferus TaxID=1737510 RepID=A0A8J4GKK7_9CHLO|nr:hypothetical protein Vretimale_12549 [Volvox reticuliferus]
MAGTLSDAVAALDVVAAADVMAIAAALERELRAITTARLVIDVSSDLHSVLLLVPIEVVMLLWDWACGLFWGGTTAGCKVRIRHTIEVASVRIEDEGGFDICDCESGSGWCSSFA